MAWHEREEGRPHYLLKIKMTRNVRRAIAAIPVERWQGRPTGGTLQVAETTLRLQGWTRARRVVVGKRVLGVVSAEKAGAFWDVEKHDLEAYVTDLPPEEATPWQVVELYRRRADAENLFDELKNQWGFNGFTSGKRAVTSMAARLLLLAYNLWNLFMRLMCPDRHVEAGGGRRWFLLIAARLTVSGRQRTLQVSVKGNWWRLLQAGYKRLCDWIKITAPQLDFGADKIDLSPLISCQIPAPNCAF